MPSSLDAVSKKASRHVAMIALYTSRLLFRRL